MFYSIFDKKQKFYLAMQSIANTIAIDCRFNVWKKDG